MAPSVSSNRNSTRFSTYSMAPTLAPSLTPSVDSVQQEINTITDNLEKLNDKKLANQRFVPSLEKSENLNKLALGAKLERALNRRMSSQDAVMRQKPKQKVGMENEKAIIA